MTECVIFEWTPELMLLQFHTNFLHPLALKDSSGLQGRKLLMQGQFQANLHKDGASTVQDVYVTVKGSNQGSATYSTTCKLDLAHLAKSSGPLPLCKL